MIEPHDHDVLAGKGNRANMHPGNKYFRELVQTKSDTYISSSNKGKKGIISQIIEHIQNRHPPGRFLSNKKDVCVWTVMEYKEVNRKVGQALRDNPPRSPTEEKKKPDKSPSTVHALHDPFNKSFDIDRLNESSWIDEKFVDLLMDSTDNNDKQNTGLKTKTGADSMDISESPPPTASLNSNPSHFQVHQDFRENAPRGILSSSAPTPNFEIHHYLTENTPQHILSSIGPAADVEFHRNLTDNIPQDILSSSTPASLFEVRQNLTDNTPQDSLSSSAPASNFEFHQNLTDNTPQHIPSSTPVSHFEVDQSFIAEHEFSDNGPSFGFHSDPPSTLQVHHDARSNQVGQSHLNQNGAALDLKQVPQNGTFSRTGLLQRFQSFSKHSISLSFRNRSQCFDEAIDDAPLTYFKSHHHTDSSDSNQDNQIYLSKSVTPIDSKPVNDFKAYGQGICSRTNLLRKFQSLSGKSISLSFRNWSRGSDDDESMDFNASISKCNFDTDIPEFNSRDNQNNRCCSSPLKFMLNRFKSMSGRSLVAWPVSAEESHHV